MMIKAEELRKGNLLHFLIKDENGGETKAEIITALTIAQIKQIDEIENPDDFWAAISITAEWLERCGFEKGDAYDISHTLERVEENYFYNDRLIWHHRLQNKSTCEAYGHIKYVHQLQNLYFCLTGAELQIKL